MVKSPENFYIKYYQALVYALIGSLFFLLGMVSWVLYQVNHKPLPEFEAIASNGNRMPLTAFDTPNYLPSTILKWARKGAVASYTFDFVNYNQQINNAAPYYTQSGWIQYKASVNRLITDISRKQLFVSSVVSGPPVIALQGNAPDNGYFWQIQMPFLVTYQSAEAVSRDSYFVVMTVVKVPTTLDPTGIGIDKFNMR